VEYAVITVLKKRGGGEHSPGHPNGCSSSLILGLGRTSWSNSEESGHDMTNAVTLTVTIMTDGDHPTHRPTNTEALVGDHMPKQLPNTF
jgi:hypothetical protein